MTVIENFAAGLIKSLPKFLTITFLWLPSWGATTYFDGRIAVFDTAKGTEHSRKVIESFSGLKKICPSCNVEHFPIYNADGSLTVPNFIARLNEAFTKGFRLYHLSWNLRLTKENLKIAEHLGELASKGVLIVGAGGSGSGVDQNPIALTETVLGQIDRNLFLIGESKTDGPPSLAPGSNFGAFFTILYPYRGWKGSSFSAPLFTEKLAEYWHRNRSLPAPEVYSRLLEKKSDRPYPNLQFLF